jgi:Na+/H+-translocating membrane pyrophosphatase
MILIGIAGGPFLIIGFLCGSMLSGIQLGLSLGIAGCAWSTIKKEIGFNNLKDDDGNQIKGDSEWAKAANIGNLIGQNLKDCVSPGISIMIVYWSLQSVVLATMYKNIHT